MRKYKKFSEVFYLLILSLLIPFYLALYGASGHEFRPEPEDVMWARVIVVAIIAMIAYFIARRFQGIWAAVIKIFFGLTLICIFYGGLQVLLFILSFEFESALVLLLALAMSIVFMYSVINIGYWLIRGKKVE
jgi:hypothetical protein